MKKKKLRVATRNRFETKGFIAEPSLLGLSHEFQYNDFQIKIELPSIDDIPKEGLDGQRLSIHGYREKNGHKDPQQLWIRSVDIQVTIPEKIPLPEQTLAKPPNQSQLFPENQQNSLNKLAQKYSAEAERAFDLWIRTLRWKSNGFMLGRPNLNDYQTGWPTYLVDTATKNRLWATPRRLTVWDGTMITSEIWNEAETSLQNGQVPPVYYDFLFDAEEHLRIRDLQRAVIDMAVSCELFLRISVEQSLPSDLNKKIRRYTSAANINQFLKHFFPELLTEDDQKSYEKLKATLEKLFDTRNMILHSGRKDDLSLKDCKRYLKATRELLSLVNDDGNL